MGGLPAAAPERKAEPLAYPAVHDMPPARTNTVLTEDEVKQAEKDLVRSRQEQQPEPGAAAKAAKQAQPASKKTKPKATPPQTETQAQQAQTR